MHIHPRLPRHDQRCLHLPCLCRALSQQKAALAASEASAREAQAAASAAEAAVSEHAARARQLQHQLADEKAHHDAELRRAEERSKQQVEAVRADARAELRAVELQLLQLRVQHTRVAGCLNTLMVPTPGAKLSALGDTTRVGSPLGW